MKTLFRSVMLALIFGAVASGAVVSMGCNKADEASPAQKEDAKKGQENAFRSQQGGGAKPAAK